MTRNSSASNVLSSSTPSKADSNDSISHGEHFNSSPSSYHDYISSLNPPNVPLKKSNIQLADPEEVLKQQGGDITRHMQHQIDNVRGTNSKRRTRLSSLSAYFPSRRGSMASDINVPGGFRREFLINKSFKENKEPPNFLTRNFLEFLSIYGHFAGEDLESDGEEENQEADEETGLLHTENGRRLNHERTEERKKGTASLPKTYFLLFKALVGSGVLFLPRAFLNGGLFFSTVVLILFGLLTFFCYLILIKSKAILGKPSFGELGYETHGKILRSFILVSIIISQIGFVATYILFTAENLLSFFNGYLDIENGAVNTKNIVIAQCLLLIPLVLIRKIAKLSLISFVSSLFIIIGLVIIFYFSISKLTYSGVGKGIIMFNRKSWPMLIGVAVTSFEGVGLILPIESSMQRPEKFPMVLFTSLLIITGLFASIGVIGYSAFGNKVKSIIILNLPETSLAVQSISVLYSLAVFLTAPLQLFPVTKILESLIFNSRIFNSNGNRMNDGKLYHNSGKYNSSIKWSKNFIRALLISIICMVAYLNADNIDRFISFNGCFACIPLVYIYPPLIHLKTYKVINQATRLDKFLKVFDYVIIGVGSVVVVYTTYQIVFID